MYEQPQPGRRVGPALIAFLVVLAAAAGSVGYFGARAIITGDGRAVTGTTANRTTQPPGPGSTTSPGSPGPGNPTTPKTPATHPTTITVTPGDKTRCPQATIDAVIAGHLNGELTLVLYVRAHRDGQADAEVWICRNADDVLIYQGHVLNGVFDVAYNARNTLLLAEGIRGTVVSDGGAGFVATNPTATSTAEYHVTRDTLVQQIKPDGTPTEYQVIDVYPAA